MCHHHLLYLCRYEVELFQKIEALTGQKMEQHPAPEQDVMLMVERVSEAGRIAHLQVRALCWMQRHHQTEWDIGCLALHTADC